MADRYWVGGAGTWTVSGTTNWSATSGGAGGASAPTSADDVYFDANSGSGAVAVSGGPSCNSLTFSGYTGTTTSASSVYVYGNLSAGTTNITWLIRLSATSSGKTVYSGTGEYQGGIYFNGVGGGWSIGGITAGAVIFFNGTITLFNDVTFTSLSNQSASNVINFSIYKIQLSGSNTIVLDAAAFPIQFTGTGHFRLWNATPPTTGTRTVTVSLGTETTSYKITVDGGSDTVKIQGSGGAVSMTDLTFTSFTGIFQMGYDFTLYGSLALSSGMTWYNGTTNTNSYVLTFASTSGATKTLGSAGVSINATVAFTGVGGVFALSNSLSLPGTRSLIISNGSFSTNSYNVSVYNFTSNYTNSRSISLGSSTVTLGGTSSAWFVDGTNLTFSAGTSTLKFTSASNKGFSHSNSPTFYNVEQAGAGSMTLPVGTYNDILNTASTATTIKFYGGSTYTLSNFSASGTAGNILTLTSSNTIRAILTKSSGTVNVSYCTISYLRAIGGARWQAYTTNGNTDGGNNLGWIFQANLGNFMAFF